MNRKKAIERTTKSMQKNAELTQKVIMKYMTDPKIAKALQGGISKAVQLKIPN